MPAMSPCAVRHGGVQPSCGSLDVAGQSPADTEGENATWRPGEVEVATRGIAACGASVSVPGEGGGSTASPMADHRHRPPESNEVGTRRAVRCYATRQAHCTAGWLFVTDSGILLRRVCGHTLDAALPDCDSIRGVSL
eukprot:1587313-Prymnesium_polylepis.1